MCIKFPLDYLIVSGVNSSHGNAVWFSIAYARPSQSNVYFVAGGNLRLVRRENLHFIFCVPQTLLEANNLQITRTAYLSN